MRVAHVPRAAGRYAGARRARVPTAARHGTATTRSTDDDEEGLGSAD